MPSSFRRKANITNNVASVTTSFLAYDQFGNLINRGMTVGITASYSINEKPQGTSDSLTASNYKSADTTYFFTEKSETLGNYVVEIKVTKSAKTYTFTYSKTAGDPVGSKTIMKQSSTVVDQGRDHWIDVYFYDSYGRNVCEDEYNCQKAMAKFTLNPSTTDAVYTFKQMNNDHSVRYYASAIDHIGEITVTGNYNDTLASLIAGLED